MSKLRAFGWCFAACGVSAAFGTWLGTGPARSPQMTILSNTSSATVMDVRVPGIIVESTSVNGESYDLVSIPGQATAAPDIGKPQVPKLSYLLGIPDNARVSVSVTVLASETLENINCYPCQMPQRDDQTENPQSQIPNSGALPDFAIDRSFYTQNTSYPRLDARVVSAGRWRELPVANIEVFPVKYNPGLRRLYVATRLRVEVSYSGGNYVRRMIEPWLARVYQSNVDNLGRLDLPVAWSDSPGVRYLVINCAKYSGSWLDSLVAWHQNQGIQTRVVTRDSWDSDQSVWDTIAEEYSRHDPPLLRWVLLVGDQYEVPMHCFHNFNNYADVRLSDYWYALMDTSSLYPDLGIGRLYADDPDDLTGQVRKILKYEKNPDCSTDWLTRVALVAHCESYPDVYSACIRGIFRYPYGYYHYTFDTIQGGAGGDNAMVSAAINQGRGIVNYRGHGTAYSWWQWNPDRECWTPGNIDALRNGDMTPVVTGFCCSNHDLAAPNCLGVSWMKKYPGGAVASLGASACSYTAPNSARDSMIFRSLADTITVLVPGGREYPCPTFDLGWMLNTADAYMLKNYNPDSTGSKENAQMFFWLGDPALDIWSGGRPAAATVDYPDGIPLGPSNLAVTVSEGGRPVPGALVCAGKDPDFYAVGHTDRNGYATLAVNARSPGCFPVTVSGGHLAGSPPTPILPFQGTCRVHTAYYVTYRRHEIDDSLPGGNRDGIVNPTETVNLPVWVVNRGSGTASGVAARLRALDRSVTVTDSVRALGTIPVGDSACTGEGGFVFRVADTCSNGHVIVFSLTTKDASDSSWTSSFPVVVGTMKPDCADQCVADPPPGGNGNQQLDPGETARLNVSLHNSGLGHGHNVMARLRSGNPRVQVMDSIVAYGAILRDSTRFSVTGFTMRADSRTAPGFPVECTLLVTGDDAFQASVPFTIVVGQAQTGDPIHDNSTPSPRYWAIDDRDVDYSEHPTFNWIEARGRGQELHLSPNRTDTRQLPADFGPINFYDQSSIYLSVCSNGWLAPGITSFATSAHAPLPTMALPTAAVCANWTALSPSVSHDVWAFHDVASHAYVVEWDSVPYTDTLLGADKFEVIIYDTTLAGPDRINPILVQYLTANGYQACTAGIQDSTLTCGLNCLYDSIYNPGTVPFHPGCAVLYTTIVPAAAAAERPLSGRRSSAGSPRLAANSPFRGAGLIRFFLPQTTTVRLLVYDAGGRLVRALIPASPHPRVSASVTWDGRSETGAIAPEGVYFYRLETGLGTTALKAIKLE